MRNRLVHDIDIRVHQEISGMNPTGFDGDFLPTVA